jgi:hypothetical protein
MNGACVAMRNVGKDTLHNKTFRLFHEDKFQKIILFKKCFKWPEHADMPILDKTESNTLAVNNVIYCTVSSLSSNLCLMACFLPRPFAVITVSTDLTTAKTDKDQYQGNMNFLYPVFGLLHVSLATVIPVMVMT